VSGFSADWLALREPFDSAAREGTWGVFDLPARAAHWRAADTTLAVLDLACGSGSNLRALAPRLGGPQCWRLIDHDPALLAAVPQAMAQWARRQGYRIASVAGPNANLRIEGPGFSADVACERLDLAQTLRNEGDAIGFARTHLVTASALLDLVSADWLDALLGRACGSGAALLFALSVDGRTEWSPPDHDDDTVHRCFSQHQRSDKGFGPALGPAAISHACQRLMEAGYETLLAKSDWVIDAGANGSAPAMLQAMIDGMAAAATEQEPAAARNIQGWKARRLAIAAGKPGNSRLTVGHIDIMAEPARSTSPGPTTDRAPLDAR
jgi:hypothetical protein